MKKLILVIILISIFGICKAQNRSIHISLDHTFRNIYLNDSDVIKNDDLYWIFIKAPKNHKQTQDMLIKLRKLNGNPNIKLSLKGSVFLESEWHLIGKPITWYGSSDTTIVYRNSVENYYRYYRIEFVSNSNIQETLIRTIKFKVFIEENLSIYELYKLYKKSLYPWTRIEFGEFMEWLETHEK